MDKVLLVGAGGFVGSVARYLLSGYVQQSASNMGFPYGTLAVNLLGCFIIGLLAQIADTRGVFTAELRALVFTGFLGGFTTFSSFGNETVNLWRADAGWAALVNVSAHIVFGLGAVWLGRVVGVWLG